MTPPESNKPLNHDPPYEKTSPLVNGTCKNPKNQYSGNKNRIDAECYDECQHPSNQGLPSAPVITNISSTKSGNDMDDKWDTYVNRNWKNISVIQTEKPQVDDKTKDAQIAF